MVANAPEHQPPLFPRLIELLQRQPAALLERIAQRWRAPLSEPASLARFITQDPQRFLDQLDAADWDEHTRPLLADMVQDFGMPVTLFPEDHQARNALASLGLIYPCPAEWGIDDPRYPQWTWTMPVEIAALCASQVPIYRPRLPLLLGRLDHDALRALARRHNLDDTPTFTDLIVGIAQHLAHPDTLPAFLLDPDWGDHLYTLQIVLEWHGICYKQELFSFAWGDNTLRPLTAHAQQRRERLVERDLLDYGILYTYTPSDDDFDTTPSPPDHARADTTVDLPPPLAANTPAASPLRLVHVLEPTPDTPTPPRAEDDDNNAHSAPPSDVSGDDSADDGDDTSAENATAAPPRPMGTVLSFRFHAKQRDAAKAAADEDAEHDDGSTSDHTSAPDDAPDTQDPGANILVVLPEELRPAVWLVNRQLQDSALTDLLADYGGWQLQPPATARPIAHEPVDRLKAFICVLDQHATPSRRRRQGKRTSNPGAPSFVWTSNHNLHPQALDALKGLEHAVGHPIADWSPLTELGLATGVLATPRKRRSGPRPITPGRQAATLLDQGALRWSRAALQSWVEGQGPRKLDVAQNEALGLTQTWLDELRRALTPSLKRVPPLESWWAYLDDDSPPRHLAIREPRHRRPIPTWLHASGQRGDDDLSCGTPREEAADRDTLTRELHIVEATYITFRLLVLDLLSGFTSPPGGLQVALLGPLLQEAAALALHLNLTTMLFDLSGQTFIPLRPPTLLVEPMSDDGFEALARALVDELLAPTGVVDYHGDRDTIRLLPHRVHVRTPTWFDHRARLDALSPLVQHPIDTLEQRQVHPKPALQSIDSSTADDPQRIWLGHSLTELRALTAGRTIRALEAGTLLLDPPSE